MHAGHWQAAEMFRLPSETTGRSQIGPSDAEIPVVGRQSCWRFILPQSSVSQIPSKSGQETLKPRKTILDGEALLSAWRHGRKVTWYWPSL